MAIELEDAETYVQGIIAAILTLAVIPSAGGHDPKTVVQRYKEVLDQLFAEGQVDRAS